MSFVCILVLFAASWRNYHKCNEGVQKSVDNISKKLETINDEIVDNNSSRIQKNQMKDITDNLSTLLVTMKDATCEITRQSQNTFDANTVTFLITFLSALLFTVFITLFVKNIEHFNHLHDLSKKLDITVLNTKGKIETIDEKIIEADKKIAEATKRINECDMKIYETKETWETISQHQIYLSTFASKRNKLTQILNLVSVLGSSLASNNYIIKEEYLTLAYMIQRKTHSLLEEGFKDLKVIQPNDKDEFMKIITDCITYIYIDMLEEKNSSGLVMLQRLNYDLSQLRDLIRKIPFE